MKFFAMLALAALFILWQASQNGRYAMTDCGAQNRRRVDAGPERQMDGPAYPQVSGFFPSGK